MRGIRMMTVGVSALALVTCGGDDDGGSAAGGDTSGATAFTGGTFQLTTHVADDQCLGGGLELLFLPNGEGTTYDLANPTGLPATADLPADIDVKLQDPFKAMTVNVKKGSDGSTMVVEDGLQPGIQVDASKYGDCTADMSIDATIDILDNDNVKLGVTIAVSNWNQGAQNLCPVEDGQLPKDGCLITLEMTGKRK